MSLLGIGAHADDRAEDAEAAAAKLWQDGKGEAALDQLDKAITASPKRLEARLLRAAIRAKLAGTEEGADKAADPVKARALLAGAIGDLKRSLKLRPSKAERKEIVATLKALKKQLAAVKKLKARVAVDKVAAPEPTVTPVAVTAAPTCSDAIACTDKCDQGVAASCRDLGRLYEKGNPARAAALYRKACDGKDLTGCVELGKRLAFAIGAPKDVLQAKALFERACDANLLLGCAQLSKMYLDSEFTDTIGTDYARAFATAKRACDGGELMGCDVLGQHYDNKRAGRLDPVLALAFYEKGCNGGYGPACGSAADVYEKGADLPKARALRRKACDSGDANECSSLGKMLREGKGGDKDFAEGASLIERGCKGGDESACMIFATILVNGDGVPPNVPRGLAILERSCASDASGSWVAGHACAHLHYIYYEGKVVPKDRSKAALYKERACKLSRGLSLCGP